MASRDINELLQPVRRRAVALSQLCDKTFAGTPISTAIVCTYRDPKEQYALYSQGRELLSKVNHSRKLVGLSPITGVENKIRTNAKPGLSAHEYRCAFDLLAFESGRIVDNGDNPVYGRIGLIGESLGLEWSGRWTGKLREAAHFQYLGGLTLDDLKKGKKPV
jgi:peptidoglycan L-alanyl-D-glutamate endopeptidase CwlK